MRIVLTSILRIPPITKEQLVEVRDGERILQLHREHVGLLRNLVGNPPVRLPDALFVVTSPSGHAH